MTFTRITALNHEIANDTMEYCIVVVASSNQFSKIATSIWGMLPIQFDCYFTLAETFNILQINFGQENNWKTHLGARAKQQKLWNRWKCGYGNQKSPLSITYDVSKTTKLGCHALSGIPFVFVAVANIFTVSHSKYTICLDSNVFWASRRQQRNTAQPCL